MTAADELVSVVIPAYNAEATIAETLRSVQAQTHQALEIVVVDDGSSDRTRGIVLEHAAHDPRIRLIAQDNAGVAAARNNGWSNACSDLVAFVDADDLWAARKIERQLEVMRDGGERMGLVYSWYALIDGQGAILNDRDRASCEGDVLERLFQGNFIGNGSSALVRRAALVYANGFESGLRAANAQGCEDILFYCRVAEKYEFGVVPEHHIGYRYLPDNMSSNLPRMLRSWMLVAAEMRRRHPGKRAILLKGLRNYSIWLVRRALFVVPGQIPGILWVLMLRNPLIGIEMLLRELPLNILRAALNWARRWRRRRRRWQPTPPQQRCFTIGAADR